MNPAAFLEFRDRLLSVSEDTCMHILDRIDAYLELAQLFQRDVQQSAIYVRMARDLIGDEQHD